jgi:hypothetical protein
MVAIDYEQARALLDIRAWLKHSLVNIGAYGRACYNERLQALLSEEQVPQQLKAAWNAGIQAITSV